LQPADATGIRVKELPQNSFEIPLSAPNTAEKIQKSEPCSKGVAREVPTPREGKAGDPSGAGKLMPLRFTDGPELHLPMMLLEQILQDSSVAHDCDEHRRLRQHHSIPLMAAGGTQTWGFRIPSQNLALRGMGLPHSLQNFVFRQQDFRAPLHRRAPKSISSRHPSWLGP